MTLEPIDPANKNAETPPQDKPPRKGPTASDKHKPDKKQATEAIHKGQRRRRASTAPLRVLPAIVIPLTDPEQERAARDALRQLYAEYLEKQGR